MFLSTCSIHIKCEEEWLINLIGEDEVVMEEAEPSNEPDCDEAVDDEGNQHHVV